MKNLNTYLHIVPVFEPLFCCQHPILLISYYKTCYGDPAHLNLKMATLNVYREIFKKKGTAEETSRKLMVPSKKMS